MPELEIGLLRRVLEVIGLGAPSYVQRLSSLKPIHIPQPQKQLQARPCRRSSRRRTCIFALSDRAYRSSSTAIRSMYAENVPSLSIDELHP
jgi:hypothetical protein